jgi:excisionase family DNA binding protein
MHDVRLLTIEQVAALCQVSVRTVYRAVSAGRLRASRLGRGGAYRIRVEDVAAWLDGSAVRASQTYPDGHPGRPAGNHHPGSLVVPDEMDRLA